MSKTDEAVTITVSPSEASCLRNLKPGEPSFTVRAQDVTSDVTVSFWVRVNCYLRDLVAKGYTKEEAIGVIKTDLETAFPLAPEITDLKLLGALETSMQMKEWPERKVAD